MFVGSGDDGQIQKVSAQQIRPTDPTKKRAFQDPAFLANGGTKKSREAIKRGLRWLAQQQQGDGSWQFSKRGNQKGFDIAATVFGLMPFLEGGYLPTKRSKYQQHVARGLKFLISQQGAKGEFEGTLYIQGLATWTLCESARLTKDPAIKKQAQLAVDYIVWAQHKAGGWRYAPRTPGDTSVTIWQMRALHSAKLAGLTVPKLTWKLAGQFLKSCEDPKGGYGYTRGHATPTMTAAGLLGRIYLGTKPKEVSFQRGLARLEGNGFAKIVSPLYHDFFDTELRFHIGGKTWAKAYPEVRDATLKTQKADGSFDNAKDRFGQSQGP